MFKKHGNGRAPKKEYFVHNEHSTITAVNHPSYSAPPSAPVHKDINAGHTDWNDYLPKEATDQQTCGNCWSWASSQYFNAMITKYRVDNGTLSQSEIAKTENLNPAPLAISTVAVSDSKTAEPMNVWKSLYDNSMLFKTSTCSLGGDLEFAVAGLQTMNLDSGESFLCPLFPLSPVLRGDYAAKRIYVGWPTKFCPDGPETNPEVQYSTEEIGVGRTADRKYGFFESTMCDAVPSEFGCPTSDKIHADAIKTLIPDKVKYANVPKLLSKLGSAPGLPHLTRVSYATDGLYEHITHMDKSPYVVYLNAMHLDDWDTKWGPSNNFDYGTHSTLMCSPSVHDLHPQDVRVVSKTTFDGLSTQAQATACFPLTVVHDIDHVMLLSNATTDTTTTTDEYKIDIKNSWGSLWGDEGHFLNTVVPPTVCTDDSQCAHFNKKLESLHSSWGATCQKQNDKSGVSICLPYPKDNTTLADFQCPNKKGDGKDNFYCVPVANTNKAFVKHAKMYVPSLPEMGVSNMLLGSLRWDDL
jgi:hypothetical protein